MSKLNEVQQRLSEIDATRFHKLVDSYLSKKHNYSIHSTGTKIGEDKPRKGTPDTLITLENGHYIFVEYTAQKTKIKDKFIDDIKKCLEPEKTGIEISKIDKIILACNSSLQSDDIEALQQACNNIECEVITNSTLSYDLVNHHPTVAKDFLGIDIGNILTPNILKKKYLTNFKTISLLTTNTPKPIDEIFVNLAIIKEKKEEKGKNKIINREALLSSYEEIHKPKEPIEINELVNKSKKSLIYGKAGIGKTTLCKYIAYKWSKKELYSEFEYLIYIPLREWKKDGIKGAIRDYYYSLDEKNISIDLNANKTLLLFDGYDELDGDKKKALIDEIDKYDLTHYLITTRPYGYQKSDFRVDEYFETIGFTDEDVEKYIDAFFKENNDKAKSLKAYLKTNISIKHIGYIPLMLEMICLQWEQKEFNESLTMTELYTQSIENIFFEYTEKNGTAYIQDKEVEIFNYLGKIAFEGLKQQTIVLDKKIIKEKRSFFSDYVLKAGFLNDGKAEKSNPLLNSYQFPHLTFQEYFSALYVSGLKPKKQEKIIQKWKFYPYMQMFFVFLGGLIKNKEFLLDEIRNEPRDIIGYYELLLLSDCLSEMKDYKNQVFINEINKKMIEWLYRIINFPNLWIERIKPYTTIFEKIQNNHYFHTQYIVDKLIKQMNSTPIRDWNINTFIAVYFHQISKKEFSFEEKIKPFLDEERLLDFEKIIKYGENTYYERDFYESKKEYEEDKKKSIEDIQYICEESITNDQEFRKALFDVLNRPFEPKIMRQKKNAMKALRKFFNVNDNDIINIALKQIKIQNEYIHLSYDGGNLLSNSISVLMDVKREDNEFIDTLLKTIKDKELDELFEKEEEEFLGSQKFKYIGNRPRDNISQKLFRINKNSPDFIEELVSIIENGYVFLENSIIVESVLKDAMTIEIFERLFNCKFYGMEDSGKSFRRFPDEDVYDKIDNHLINFNRNQTFLQGIKIEVLFQAYDKGYDISTIILSNLIFSNKPLYINKNNQLCTIENGKEISTQREVDETTLNEIKMILKGDN